MPVRIGLLRLATLVMLLGGSACSSGAIPAATSVPALAPTAVPATRPAATTAPAAAQPAPAVASSQTTPDYLKKAQDLVGASTRPPTFADIRPSTAAPPFKPGLRIAVLLATARSTGAQIQARGVEDAAATVGWQTVEFDGQGTNQGRLAAFRTILTQKFDGIVLVATDQRVVGDAMQEAYAQGVPVTSTMAGNEPGNTPTQVFADAGMDDLQEGRKAGSWIVADAAASGVPVNTLLFLNPVNRTVEQRDAGVNEVLK
ncbi:MAG TPA: substrate-binding domain-containing protein, partial [Chloroflexota bacterium]